MPMFAQETGQQTFSSVADAGRAFFTAMQSPEDHSILKILGSAGEEIISSGDPVEDLDARTNFTTKYEEMHRFVTEPNGSVTMIVGAENWPLPIPLVKKNGAWYFDTQAGKDEILFRRIGKNEMYAIQACGDLVDAEKQYYDKAPNGLAKEYAQKLVSDDGKHNGLYWQDTGDQFNSPINPSDRLRTPKSPGERSWGARSIQWVFLPNPHEPGTSCAWRSKELRRQREDDFRFRFRRLPGGVPLFWRDDFHCQQNGNRL